MAVVHHTTLVPTKLELLTSWLPGQGWYVATGREPELAKAGGFRLDDPQGEVGIELMAVTDASGGQPRSYFVPVSYRGAPLEGAEHALIGTLEHGVLGPRWVYDGVHDPVVVAQLIALLNGEVEPQAQSETDTLDPTVVTSVFTGTGLSAKNGVAAVTEGPRNTDLLVPTEDARNEQLTIRVTRLLTADAPETAGTTATADADLGHVTAGWTVPDGATARAVFVAVRA